ncbi:MAG TPA: hypothetical protein VF723_12325 [Pyrinomonadaceae bacterium]|jgi:hypothetical protein
MRIPTRLLVISLALSLVALPAFGLAAKRQAQTAGASSAQQSAGALERGYRAGYSDGYPAGYRDTANGAARDFRNKEEYRSANRAYATSYGPLEDYRDGYQQGFEAGYGAGYDRRGFDSTVPAGLARRGVDEEQGSSSNTGVSVSTGGTTSAPSGNASFIPADTVMRVELLTNLSTDATQRGDRFQARVIEPAEYADAMLQGQVTRVKRPGKLKGSAELQLSFEQISLGNRWTRLEAQVIEVVDSGSGEGVGEVDPEGGVKGKDRTKDDIAKVGASTGIGAIIGAIAGGGKGAAIGAVIGGAIGTGGVMTTRGRDIRLMRGQHLRIRTSSDTRFQP